jgi:hypothetical protein
MTPTGSERVADTRIELGSTVNLPPQSPPSQAINDSEAEELLALWARIDDAGRRDLLAVARGLASVPMRARGE